MMPTRKLQPPGYAFESPDYGEFQVILVQKGLLTLQVQETVLDLQPGSIALLRTGSRFKLSSKEGYRGLGLIDREPADPAYQGETAGFAADSLVHTTAELIEHYMLLPDRQSRPILESLSEAMARQVIELDRKRLSSKGPAWPDVIQAVLDINLGTGMSASEALAHLPLGYRQLSRLFMADRGMTPKQYLLRARVNEASRLLANSKLSITEIAMELGFASSQHLATQFKMVTGQTPRSYRAASRPEAS